MSGEKTVFPSVLRDVRVFAISSADAQRWDALMCEHHYLGSTGLVGERIRQVAVDGQGRWLALIGWSTAAFKCQARDRWIGWCPSQQWRRLPLVANNSRFLVLPWARQTHLASRVLGLAVRRVSADFRCQYGHGLALAETFVDGSRFRGICYRAAGWVEVGTTRGFRRSAGRYVAHGQPKLVLVKPLHRAAKELLTSAAAPTTLLPKEIHMDPLALQITGPGSLKEALGQVADPRDKQGSSQRDFAGILTLLTMATLAGMKTLLAIADYVAELPEEVLKSCGCRCDGHGHPRPPSEATLRRATAAVDGNQLDQVVGKWLHTRSSWRDDEAIAIDGKTLRGSHLAGKEQVQLVAACTHTTGAVLAQMAVEHTDGELPLGAAILDELPEDFIRGRMVTYDALHTQHEHAIAVCKKGGDFLLTVKGNQPTLLKRVEDLFSSRPLTDPDYQGANRGHARKELRRIWVVDIPRKYLTGGFALARQAIRIERQVVRDGKHTLEVVYAITSRPKYRANAEQLAAFIRGHWSIENRVHHVRDVTFDEDRSRVRTDNSPRVLATFRNLAISILRIVGVTNIAGGLRHCCFSLRYLLRLVAAKGGRG